MDRVEPPVIDIAALVDPAAPPARRREVGARIAGASRGLGFFQVVGHGVDPSLRAELLHSARRFFALPADEKDRIAMRHAGRAWRGWFPVGGELTSGVADLKEGLYFGTEHGTDDPRVRDGLPLHGPNQFPERPADLRRQVLDWIDAVTAAGQAVLRGIALGLGLEERWFDRWCTDPTVLFRIFHYPPPAPGATGDWGVAEHTDYGLLTMLAQDDAGGLEVRAAGEWTRVPVVADAFVCNLGDMLERMTGGELRSTPHRVTVPDVHRYSMALFLDPAWTAHVAPLPGREPSRDVAAATAADRWDGASVFDDERTYGEHLTSRVARVFPDLFRSGAPDGPGDGRPTG